MPQSTGVRASTQDNSAGTLVARGVSEVAGSGDLQTLIAEGNKTTYAEVSRTGITAADAPTGGNVTNGAGGFGNTGLIDTGNATSAAIRATCGTASATLKGRLVFYDGSGNCIGISPQQTFIADATLRLGNAAGDFISTTPPPIELGAARQTKFFVDSVTAGTWAIYVRPI